jgi:hypothetical protein
MRRWRHWIVVAAVAVGLVLAGRIAAPPATTPPATAPPAASRPVDTRRSCDPNGLITRPAPLTDGPQQHPPIAGLRLDPATSRPGDLSSGRAEALARELVGSTVDGITTHARLLRVTRPPALRDRRAWVVAVAGVPAGLGYCGPIGSREVVVLLDPVTGRELWRYSYR